MISSPAQKPSGMTGWLLQRVSGIFLAYALGVHLWAVHYVNMDRLTWETITTRLQDGTFWSIYYILFIPAVVYHALNGIWGIVLDYNPSPALRKAWAAILWAGGLLLLIYGYFGLKPLTG